MNKLLILPFQIHQKLAALDYLSEGILEELIDCLNTLDNLKTSSRSTSLYLKENPLPHFHLKEKLQVDYVVEGAVKLIEERYYITYRLVDCTTDDTVLQSKHLFDINHWTLSVAKVYDDLLTHFRLTTREVVKEEVNKAREYYLQGRYHWRRYSFEEMKLAITCFQASLKENKNYALAYAGLADCYSVIGVMGFDAPNPAFELAKKYVKKSIQLNDKRSESYVSQAIINLFSGFDFNSAKENLNYAIRLNPESIDALHALAMYSVSNGSLEEAEAYSLKTIELDPMSLPHYGLMIRIMVMQKKYDEAMDYVNAVYSIEPNAVVFDELKGEIYLHTGHIEKAIEVFKGCLKQNKDNLYVYGLLSYAYAKADFIDDSLTIESLLEEQRTPQTDAVYYSSKALVKLGHGDNDSFFKYIDLALGAGLGILMGSFLRNPLFEELRKTNSYRELIDKYIPKNLEKGTRKYPISSVTIQSNSKETLIIDPQDILWVESEGNYCTVYSLEDKVVKHRLLRITLKQLGNQLADYSYLYRCHKSFMINLNEVSLLSGNAKGYLLNHKWGEAPVPVSRGKNEEIKSILASIV